MDCMENMVRVVTVVCFELAKNYLKVNPEPAYNDCLDSTVVAVLDVAQ